MQATDPGNKVNEKLTLHRQELEDFGSFSNATSHQVQQTGEFQSCELVGYTSDLIDAEAQETIPDTTGTVAEKQSVFSRLVSMFLACFEKIPSAIGPHTGDQVVVRSKENLQRHSREVLPVETDRQAQLNDTLIRERIERYKASGL